MLSSEQVFEAEEQLRKNVRELPDDKRLAFLRQPSKG